MITSVKILFSILVLLAVTFGQRTQVEEELVRRLVCVQHEECGPCLAAASHCRWCADPYFKTATVPRCNDEASLVEARCSQYAIEQPAPAVLEVKDDRPLQDRQPDNATAAVQIRPQNIRLSLRPQESRSIKFTYRPARNYPLDLYYLMDLTWTMKDDKEMLVSLRDDLPVMLKNLTDNFRLGFGSFAEKPIMPFISTDQHRKENPCASQENVCDATYSFRHHLSLTAEVSQFINHVNSSSVTANLDNAEAGLDALMQTLVCTKEIAWDDASRKIIIVLSDGLLHFAGDGKLGGAIERNDGQCHLDENGYYSAATLFDYPSLAQIHRLLAAKKVNVIFAVTEDVKYHYDSLHHLMEKNTYIGKLEADSSNILKLVKTGYEDIVKLVNFEDDNSGPVKMLYYSDCGNEKMEERNKCTDVEFGKEYNFEVMLRLDACPKYTNGQKQTITISETQLGQDSLTLEVELLCGCGCEGADTDAEAVCPEHSRMICGICQCLDDWSGPNCDCLVSDHAASVALTAQCREPNATKVDCSGAGDCLCGQCHCDPGRSGKYCQCKPCPFNPENGLECGGVDHGACGCGSCTCGHGWSGDSCSCSGRQDTCIALGDTEPCSGHGDCTCGKCQCSMNDGIRYAGEFCETCATCDNAMCTLCQACVACTVLDNCTTECGKGEVTCNVTKDIKDITVNGSAAAPADKQQALCIVRTEEDGLECEYEYTYKPLESRVIAATVRNRKCAKFRSAMIMRSGLIIMAVTVAMGVVVIAIVKTFQIVQDQRAYAKFNAEAEFSMVNMSNQNPLQLALVAEPETSKEDRTQPMTPLLTKPRSGRRHASYKADEKVVVQFINTPFEDPQVVGGREHTHRKTIPHFRRTT